MSNQHKPSGAQQRWNPEDLIGTLTPYLTAPGTYSGYWDITFGRFDWIGHIALVDGGYGYFNPPTVTINGDGIGATADAILDGAGGIEKIVITNKGSGYTTASVIITPNVLDTVTYSPASATAYIAAGAVSSSDVIADTTNEPITIMTNLFKDTSAEAVIVGTDSVDIQVYRKDVVCETGHYYPKIPLMFYPLGYFDGVDVDGDPNWENTMPPIGVITGNINIPPATYVPGYCMVIAGTKMLHQIGELAMLAPIAEVFIGALGGSTFPVPLDPGSLIINVTVGIDNRPQMETFVNGKYVSTTQATAGDPLPPGGFDNTAVNEFFGLMSWPCFGVQKMGVFTRNIPLTPEEVWEIHMAIITNLEHV